MSDGGDNEIKETGAEKEESRWAIRMWNNYQETGLPALEHYQGEVNQMNSEANRSFARGAAGQSVSDVYGNAAEQTKKANAATGLNPNSGRYKENLSSLAESQGATAGEAIGKADNQQTENYLTGLSNVIAIGEGEATTATAGLSDIASQSSAEATNRAVSNYNNSVAWGNAVGSAAGAGLAYYQKPDSSSSTYDSYINSNQDQYAGLYGSSGFTDLSQMNG